jgi:hypothetical protein
MGKHEEIGQEIGELVDRKNAAYGNSFDLSGEFLRLLYPNGLKPEQYHDALSLVRIFDKMKRIASDARAFGENPYQDIAGYSILAVRRDREMTAEPRPVVEVLAEQLETLKREHRLTLGELEQEVSRSEELERERNELRERFIDGPRRLEQEQKRAEQERVRLEMQKALEEAQRKQFLATAKSEGEWMRKVDEQERRADPKAIASGAAVSLYEQGGIKVESGDR